MPMSLCTREKKSILLNCIEFQGDGLMGISGGTGEVRQDYDDLTK